MHIDHEILKAAGELIAGAISNGLPTEDAAEFHGLDDRGQRILEDLLDELTPMDLRHALDNAAERMDESDFDDDEDSEVTA